MPNNNWEGGERRRSMDSKLEEMNGRLIRLEAIYAEQSKTIAEIVNKHEHLLYGNGSVGLKSQVESLNSSRKISEKHAYAAWMALIGLFVKIIWEFLSKRVL